MALGANKYGIFNDSNYPVTRHVNKKKVWTCPIYSLWYDMWARVSDPIQYPSYLGCSVSEDWRYFSNFISWVKSQDWEGKFLDKDLLVENNKVYSANHCCFVSREVNNFLVKPKERKDLPLGVCLLKGQRKNAYLSQCGMGHSKKFSKSFPSATSAHRGWQIAKLNRLNELLLQEKDTVVLQGLLRIRTKLEYQIINNIETEDL